MTGIRYVEDVAHLVPSGMHDSKAEVCSMVIWRQGKQFKIEVRADDVRGTAFHEFWKSLTFANDISEFERWHNLCDEIIRLALNLLKELAPVQSHWRSLQSYLHTPSFSMKLITDPTTREVRADLIDGPVDTPAYNMLVSPASRIPDGLEAVKRYPSSDLMILQLENDGRAVPRKISTPEHTIRYFIPLERPLTNPDTGDGEDSSWGSVSAYCELDKFLSRGPGTGITQVPGLREIVMNDGLFAGILVDYIQHCKSLASLLEDDSANQAHRIQQHSSIWHKQVETTVNELHDIGFAGIDSSFGRGIDPNNLLVDRDDKIWLPLQSGTMKVDSNADDVQNSVQNDLNAVEAVFTTWLPRKMAEHDDGLSHGP